MLYCLGSGQELLSELGIDALVPGFQELLMTIITFVDVGGVVKINGMVRDYTWFDILQPLATVLTFLMFFCLLCLHVRISDHCTEIIPWTDNGIDNVRLTNGRPFFMRLPCYWWWISSSHCQSSCGSTRSGSADYFDNVVTKFMINNRTDA